MTTVSVIIATYNNPKLLELVLETFREQVRPPDQIVIADDGSGEATAAVINQFRSSTSIEVLHAWHEDKGFRLAASRNNAIRLSSGEYLIFLDGDCYANPYFVADHLAVAKKGCFVAGTRVNIKPSRQEYIRRTGDRSIHVWSSGTSKRFHAIRFPFFPLLTAKTQYFPGANFAVWREDLERVNGLNEDFEGHGGEDVELAIRLTNAGVQGLKMRHGGMLYHFAHPDHPRGDRSRIAEIINHGRTTKSTWCQRGLTRE
jgi:GT2 family glycosyltransferase